MKLPKRKGWHSGKPATLLVSLLLIFGVVACGTISYIFVSSVLLNNSLKVVSVSSAVVETFNGTTKSNAKIKNMGDIDAWIRVAIVPTWEVYENNLYKAVNESANLSDLNISINTSNWFEKNGFYYCKTKIAPNESTPVLINSASVKTSSVGYLAGYQMNLQILCEAIQAAPDATAAEAWPAVRVVSGSLVG